MNRTIQVDPLREHLGPLRNWDSPIRLYYDETNNIRRLTLSDLGLNVPENKVFVIAGVALHQGTAITDWPALRQSLQIQDNAPEIKLKHVAQGSYLDILGSRKLATLLDWILERDMMIHYSAMDPLYWSILDVVESLMTEARLAVAPIHRELKSELHHAIVQDLPSSLALLNAFDYPNVSPEQVNDFLRVVLAHVELMVPDDRNFVTTALKQTLRHASRLPGLELTFLHNNKPGALIDDFSAQFLHRIYIFKHASHVFDREKMIEKILRDVELHDGHRQLDYRFADSKSEIGIQLSDILAGVIGSYFCHLQDHTLGQLLRQKESFSLAQRDNLHSLRTLIDRSDNFSEGLFHTSLPLDTIFKNSAFLHEQSVPPHMHE